MLFEALEDRRVLAVTPLTDPEIASLRNNVAVLQSFGDRLEDFAQLNSTFPLFESTIGELVDIGGAFGETFVTPLQNYLDSANPTIQGLQNVVATVIANNFHISGEAKAPTISPEELSFTIDVSFFRTISAEIDLADHVPESELNVEGSLSGELQFEFNFNVTIGIDRTKASVAEGAFVEFSDESGENSITAELNLNTPQPIQASLGILGVTLDNPSIELNLGASFDTINKRVFVSDLASADLASLVTVNTAGANNFNLTLPINAQIAGTTLAGGQLTVVDTNLFDSIKPTIDIVTDDFDPFRTISTTGLLSVLNQARNVLGGIDAFDIEIPFTGGTKLSDVLNLGQAIGDQIIDPVSNPEQEGQPGFSNLQQFLSLVADSARYDAATKSIEFDIRFDHTFDIASFAVDFGASLGDLNNFSLSADTKLSVAADLGAAFTVGLVLAQPGAAFDPDGDSIFGIEMDTHLSQLNAGKGVPTVAGHDFRVTLRDGTTKDIDLNETSTVGDLISALTTGVLAGKLEVTFDQQTDILNGGTFASGLNLVDKTTGTTNSALRITKLNDSLAATALSISGNGLAGIYKKADGSLDEVTHGIRTGQLHGQSLADNLYFTTIAGSPMFSASASLTADINGSAKLGFIEIGIDGGQAVGRLAAEFTLTDPNPENAPNTVDRISGGEIFELASAATLSLKGTRPIALNEAYSGTVQVAITNSNGSIDTVPIPFSFQPEAVPADSESDPVDPVDAMVDQMNDWLERSQAAGADLIRVGSSGGKLTFSLNDGVARRMSVDAGAAGSAVAKLGITTALSGYIARPLIKGSANFNFPITADLGGIIPTLQRTLSFDIPDLANPEFNLSDAINIDFGGLGDSLTRLKQLDVSTIIQTLQGALEFLRSLEGFDGAPFLNEPLPLLGTDLKSILNIADTFGDIVVQLQENPGEGLGQFDEIFEDILGIPENSAGQVGLPSFPVSIFPEFNKGKVFNGVALDNAAKFKTDFPSGIEFLGKTHRTLKDFLDAIQGDDTNAVELTLDSTSFENPALRIDLKFGIGDGFGFNVAPLGVQIPVSIDLADLGVAGLSDFVDARGEALVDVQGLGQIHLALGIDLPDEGFPRPFLYDGTANGTRLDLFIKAGLEDFQFEVAIGPLGAAINNGQLGFGGNTGPSGTDEGFAKFSVALADDNADGRHFFGEIVSTVTDGLSLSDFEFSAVGSAGFNGDLSFPGLDLSVIPGLPAALEFDFALTDINSVVDGITAEDFTVTIADQDAKELLDKVRDILAGDFNLLSLVGGWDGAFDLIIDAMEGEVFGIELPFIGDKLKDQANFLRNIKDSVSGNLSDNAENESNDVYVNPFDDVRQDILDAIGPNGINLLKDLTGDNQVTIDDVVIEQLNPGIGFEILIGSDLAQFDLPIDFDLGIPGLGLDIDANVTGSLGFEFGLRFGVDLVNGFFIDTNRTFLEVFVDVGVPGLSALGELGFLRVKADEILKSADAIIGRDAAIASQLVISSVAMGSPANFDVRFVQDGAVASGTASGSFNTSDRILTLKINSATTTALEIVNLITTDPVLKTHFTAALAEGSDGSGLVSSSQRSLGVTNSFAGRFNVNFLDPDKENPDGMLTLAEIFRVKSFKDVISIDATAIAGLDLELAAMIGEGGAFPSIYTDLSVDWDFKLGGGLQLPTIELSNLELGLGEFFGNFASDIFGEVEKVLEPVRPIIKFLNDPLPVVSDLRGSDVTVLDLLRLQGGPVERAVAFIEAVSKLDNIIANLPDLGDARLPLGGATYDPNTGEFMITGTLADVRAAFTSAVNAAADTDPTATNIDPSEFLQTPEDLAEVAEDKIKLGFPLLDPSNVMKILSGQVVELFTLELPTLTLDSSIKRFYPLPAFPAVGVELGGTFKAIADFAFGFDTFGIEQFKQTGNFANILNGFYVFDHETADGGGEDINEVVLNAEITAAAVLDVGVLRAVVGGGLGATINFNLHDNNDDGKIRLVELLDNTLLGTQDGLGPIHIFDVSGSFDARLFAEITVDLGVVKIDKSLDIANVTLFDFNFPRPSGEGVPLATMSGSTMLLNIGPRAGERRFFFTEDVAEDYKIYAGTSAGTVIVEAFGRSQIYTGVSRIVGDAGLGDDKIFISDEITIPVELFGGPGNDVLIGGSGDDILDGGDGNDELIGGRGNDRLIGGSGRDKLMGDQGDDVLDGGDGDDELFGGDGNDIIRGGAGNDRIMAGAGDDVVYAGPGFDVVFGEAGNDELHGDDGQGGPDDADKIYGGDGADIIFGGAGDDELFGNDGNDIIRGGTGNDVIYGGVGNDTIYGDQGNDRLYGENSRDIIYGGDGDDMLFGGLGSDELYGGLGDDQLFFNTADLTEIDEAGHLLLGGGGNDRIWASPLEFDNTIFGDGVNDEFGTIDPTTDGNDQIHGGGGRDTVYAGGGNDIVYTFAGNDFIDAGPGNDTVYAGAGNDFVIGGFGDDHLFGQEGNDVIWGGFAFSSDITKFDFANPANFELPPRYAETEAKYPTGYVPGLNVTPVIVGGVSIDGVPGDGRDMIDGGQGNDLLFGGSDSDVILGGDGADYIDAGAGNDINVNGGAGDDVIRGGGNNDVLHGGSGIDHILGDDGDDQLFGDAGTGSNLLGQRLFGGDGNDVLFAYAPTPISNDEQTLRGDQLFGDAGGDTLNGNLRGELLVGGDGDDLIRGDYLAGPNYSINLLADQTGGDDLIFGGGGQDALFGGGGNDTIWGGPDGDYIDGQKGDDTLYGGSGNDRFVVSAMKINESTGAQLQAGSDTIDGHYGNFVQGDSVDDSTDVLIIDGSGLNDVIGLSQSIPTTGQPQLRIDYKPGIHASRPILVTWLSGSGNPLVEQFQIAGLGGNDIIGFAGVHPTLLPLVDPSKSRRLDLSKLTSRSKDWTSTLEGNSGNDTIIGSSGRDRIDGGAGSDMLFGFAGDDRLIGDGGSGFSTDIDTLFAGQGNDDLIGGQGRNNLYAWSLDPSVGEFGIYVDASGNFFNDSASQTRIKENTGLNRMLGNIRADNLYGGTVLDFMLGQGGGDVLYRANGSTFESMGGAIPGDEWKQYAKDTGQVWYVSGTNADDQISVNFVTEPGLLSDHHLITRLTNNNGNFSFDAQVRLDFAATDSDGNAIWSPNDLLFDYNALRRAKNDAEIAGVVSDDTATYETNLINNLLPPEGDFLAIIIDALDGNDTITIGPTVQKSVWIDAGAGDDTVTILSGNAILVDKAETGRTGGLLGRNDDPARAFSLEVAATGTQFTGLTIDNPNDIDWYKFAVPAVTGSLNVVTESPADDLTIRIFGLDRLTNPAAAALASVKTKQAASINLANVAGLTAGSQYLLQVQTDKTPTIYGVEFNLGGTASRIDLGLRSDAIRRDIILGGDGDDILMGGAGEDWILGGAGNDVISGGRDRMASDILIGGDGDDTFQIIPDFLPVLGNQQNTVFDPVAKSFRPAASDQIDGGDGNDRILYVGGDLDRRGFEVPDFAAIRYDNFAHRYEFTSLVWDIGLQRFALDPDSPAVYLRQYLFYQTKNVEETQIELQRGDDTFHADPGYLFPASVGRVGTEEWGIKLGNYENRALEAALTINGGAGDDELFGGALDDTIYGGPGNDIIMGYQGNDRLYGGGGDDTIFGLKDTTQTPLSPRTPDQILGRRSFGFSEYYNYSLVAPFFAVQPEERPGIELHELLPQPVLYYSFDAEAGLISDDSGRGNDAVPSNVSWSSAGLRGGAASFNSQQAALVIGTSGVDVSDNWTASAWVKGIIDTPAWNSLFAGIGGIQLTVAGGSNNVGTFIYGQPGIVDSGFDIDPQGWIGQWHQIVVVGSGSQTEYFLDGVSVGVSAQKSPSHFNRIGNDYGNARFAEFLDEVYIFDVAFSAEQVQRHYQATQLPSLDVATSAFGLEGASPNEQLSSLRPIGDFNGDGLDDFIASSQTHSYILLGPLALDDMERIDEYAEIIIDHAALGRPAKRFGDINGDGLGDLVFTRDDQGNRLVTIVFGGANMQINGSPQPWIRLWDQSFVNNYVNSDGVSSFRVIDLTGASLSPTSTLHTHLLEITGDAFDDLVIITDSSTNANSIVTGKYNLGYVFSGSVITANSSLTISNRLAILRTDGVIADLPSTVAGDVNGDGIEELLFGNTSVNITVDAVAPAISTGSSMPNSESTELEVSLNNVSATFRVELARNVSMTAANFAAKINELLSTTSLAGQVFARTNDRGTPGIPQDDVLEFYSDAGGDDIQLVVIEKPDKANETLGFYNATHHFASADVPKIISANGANNQQYLSTINVPTVGIVKDVNVTFNISHSWVGDIELYLTHGQGENSVTRRLFYSVGGSSDNFFNTTLDDEASLRLRDGVAPFSGSYRPDLPLNIFDGRDASGVWTLKIVDVYGAADGGSLNSWSLDLKLQPVDLPDHGTETSLRDTSLPSPLLSDLSDGHSLRVTVSTTAPAKQPIALGDLNNDGYDDIGFSDSGFLEIYYGDADLSKILERDIRLADNSLKSNNPYAPGVAGFTEFNGAIYFQADDGVHGNELWRYDGSSIPQLVADINPNGSSNVLDLIVFNGELYFSADDGSVAGRELWKYNGIDDPVMAVDINPTTGSNPFQMTELNGALYFAATGSDAIGDELWRWDGTTASLVKDIQTGTNVSSTPRGFTRFNNKLYFSAWGNGTGNEIWETDGTNAGTHLINDIFPGLFGSFPRDFAVFGNSLYFAAVSPSLGRELFRYDGINPPSVVFDIAPIGNGSSSNPAELTVFNGRLYFSAQTNNTGNELYYYDGRTVHVVDIASGSASSTPRGLTVFNGALYFSANDGTHGIELWRYSGDRAVRVSDLNDSEGSSSPTSLTAIGDSLYFFASDGVNGIELWRRTSAPQHAIEATVGNDITASAGDFNVDGSVDLAVIEASSNNDATVSIFYSIAESIAKLNLAQADVTLAFSGAKVLDSGMPSFDLNNDGIDDLVLPAAMAESNTGVVLAGRVYAIYGDYRRIALPTTSIVDLENYAVPGSGSFVVDLATGRADVFTNAGVPYTVTSDTDQWFRFSTLGNGAEGDFIRLVDQGPSNYLLPEVAVNSPRASAQNLDHAVWTKNYHPDIEDSLSLPHVSIAGTGDGTVDYYSFSATAGSRAIFDIDNTSPTLDAEIFLFNSSGTQLAQNDDNGRVDPGSTAIRDSSISYELESTGIYYIRVARYLGVNAGGGPLLAGHTYVLHVSVENHPINSFAPTADLIDSRGGVLKSNQSLFDLRGVPAGEYYLRVSTSSSVARPFAIEFDAPSFHYSGSSTLPDRDFIDGGDGNDTIHGNNDLDRIFGSSGADTVFAESIEFRDSSLGDARQLVNTTESLAQDLRTPADSVVELPGVYITATAFSDTFSGSTWDSRKWSHHDADIGDSVFLYGYGDFATDFSSPPALIQSSGSAQFSGGALLLVPPDSSVSGTAIINASSIDVSEGFTVSFDLYIGSGNITDGMSFVFGDVTTTNITEEFLGTGVSLSIQPLKNRLVLRYFNGSQTTFRAIPLPNAQMRDRHLPARLDVDADGRATVWWNGAIVAESVTLDGWDPQTSYRFAFGSRNGANWDGQLIDNLRISLTKSRASFTSQYMDLSSYPFATLSYKSLRGIPLLPSRAPNDGDNLLVEYRISGGDWQSLDTHFGNGAADNAYIQRELTLPQSALNSRVQFRFRSVRNADQLGDPQLQQTDLWVIDDVFINGAVESLSPLAIAISQVLGKPVTAGAFGVQVAHDSFLASELASIAQLDLRSRGIDSLKGLAELVQLRKLDLAANAIADDDLAVIGNLQYLESLNLSGNTAITSVTALTSLPVLRHLFMENTAVNVNPATNPVLSSLRRLETLTLPITGLFPGQNLVTQVAQPIRLRTNSVGAWSVVNESGTVVQSGSGSLILFTPTTAGMFTVTHAATGPFPIYARSSGPVITGLPATFNIDEGQTRTVDQLLSGVNLTPAGTVSQVTVTGPDGVISDLTTGSLQLSNDVINLDSTILNGASDLTVAFWLRTTNVADFQAILSAANAQVFNEFLIGIEGTNRIYIETNIRLLRVSLNATLTDGQWHHITIVRSATNNRVSLYYGGQQVATNATFGTLAPLNVQPGGLLIGQEQDSLGGGFDPAQSFNGSLDDFAIWRRELTPAQIAAIYNDGVKNTDADLAAYYPLNDLGGDVIEDRSPNGRDGVISEPNGSPTPNFNPLTSVVWSVDSAIQPKLFNAVDEGNYQLVVTARDSSGGKARAESIIQVNNVAPQPTITASPPLVDVIAGQSFVLTATSSDPGILDDVTYDWEVTSNNGQTFFGSNSSTFNFTPEFAGRYTIKLIASDNAGDSLSVTEHVDVKPMLPNFGVISGVEGSAITLSASNASPLAPGAIRTYAWQFRNSLRAIDTGTGESFTFVPPDNGSYFYTLVITDNVGGVPYGSVAFDVFSITNANPVIQFGSATFANEGSPVALTPVITDPGIQDTFTYIWTITDPNDQAVTPTDSEDPSTIKFTPVRNGIYNVSLKVIDKDGGQATNSTTVIVSNVAPVVNAGANQTINEGTGGNQITFSGSFTDAGGNVDQPFSYVWNFGDGTSQAGTRAVTGTLPPVNHTYADSGIYNATLTVTDKDGGVGVATTVITIVNLAPQNLVLSGPANATAAQNRTVLFTGTVSDLHVPGGGEPLRGKIDFGNGVVLPVILSAPTVNGVMADYTFSARHIYAQPGVYNVVVEVRDDDGGVSQSSPLEITITDDIAPTITASVSPRRRNTAVDSISLNFSESIINFEVNDLVLSRNGGANLLTAAQTVVNNGNGTWTLVGLSAITSIEGDYQLTLDAAASGVVDLAGNALANNLSVLWSLDTTAPIVTVNTVTTNSSRPALSGTIDDPAATIAVTVNGMTYPATNAGDGTWRVAAGVIATLPENVYDVAVTATDLASNQGTDTTNNELTVSVAPISANVMIDANNDIVIQSIAGLNLSDRLTLKIDGSNLRVSDPTFTLVAAGGTVQNGRDVLVPMSSIQNDTRIVVNTLTGIDTVTLDLSGGSFGKVFEFAGANLTTNLVGELHPQLSLDQSVGVLEVVGNLSIGTNATLTLDALNGFVPSAGDTFAIIQRSGGGGVFAGLPQGTLITNFLGSGLGATINYFGGTSGFDVVLSVGSATTETFVSIDANGNLNIADTVNDSADNLRLHTDGTNLIVVDESATPLLLGTDIAAAVGNGTNRLTIPLNLITGAIRVNVGASNNTRNDRITIDYASGGFFAVPGGIDVAGSNGTDDLLTVLGTGNTQANYSTLMAPLGPTQLRLSDTLGTTAIRYSNFDNLVFTALQTFVAENLLVIGTGSLTVGSNTPVNLPTLTLLNGGTFTADQIALGSGEAITGNGAIHARFAGEAGSVLTVTGNLSIGNPVAVDGFLTRGEIDVKDHTLTLWDANEAVLGSLTKLGSEPGPAATAGTLVSENGILIDQGNNLIGFGTVEIPNDIALLSYINGNVQGTSTEKPITLTGYIKGIGQLDNVNLTGTYSPGFSPAIAVNGSVTYAPDSVLIVELVSVRKPV